MGDHKVVIDVDVDEGNAKKSIDGLKGDINGIGDSGAQAGSKLSSGLGGALKKVGIAVAGAFAVDKMKDFFASAVQGSASLQALNSQFDQVFGKAQGQATEMLNEMGKTFGMVPDRLKAPLTQTTSMFKGLGLSTKESMGLAEDAVTAVADASAFYDMSFEDANSALNSFIKGNYEGGEAIGLFANETQMADWATKNLGISWKDATEAQKQTARLKFAEQMQKLAGATGQASRESDGLENVMGNLKATWEKFKAVLGGAFLPTVIKGLQGLGNVIKNINVDAMVAGIKSFGGWMVSTFAPLVTVIKDKFVTLFQTITGGASASDGFNLIKTAVEGLGTAISATVGFVTSFIQNFDFLIAGVTAGVIAYGAITLAQTAWTTAITVWSNVTKIATAVQTAFNLVMSANPIALVVLAVASLVAIGILLYKNWDTVKNTMSSVWSWMQSTASTVFTAVSNAISSAWNTVKSATISIWNGIKSAISSAWNGIKSVIMAVVTPIVNTVKQYFNNMKSSLTQIFNGIKSYFTAVWGVIKTIFLGAILLIVDLVKGDFTRLKSDAMQIFNTLKGYFSQIWSAIKSIFSGVIGAIVAYVSTAWGNMKSNTSAVFNSLKGIASKAWNAVKSAVTTALSAIRDGIKNGMSTAKSVMSSAWNAIVGVVKSVAGRIKSAITNIKDTIVNGLKNIDLLQIGKNIMDGLVNGITSGIKNVTSAISGVANAIPDKIRKILGIHSPSRVLKEIGKWTIKGLVVGISGMQPIVTKTMTALGKALISTTNANSKAIKKIHTQLTKDIAKIKKEENVTISKLVGDKARQIEKINETANSRIARIEASVSGKKKALTKADKLAIQKIEKDANDKIAEMTGKHGEKILALKKKNNEKIVSLKKKASADEKKIQEQYDKDNLDAIQNFIDNKKSLNQLSLVEEVQIWKNSISLFKKGSDERIKAQQNYQSSLKSLNDQIVSINEEYQQKMKQINDDLVSQEEELNAKYDEAFNSRVDKLTNFASLFDAFKDDFEGSGYDLMYNLQSQVSALAEWEKQFDSFASRGLSQNLVDEISSMGVEALPQLRALNRMTDDELSQYSMLYEEKSRLARERATAELSGMKDDTIVKIDELRLGANEKLDQLQIEWDSAIKKVVFNTSDGLKGMKQIGKNAGQGLYDGLEAMEPRLLAKARAIAEAIKATIQSALDIHSPSRWMRDFIAKNMMIGFDDGTDKYIGIAEDASNRMAEAMTPKVSNILGSAKKLAKTAISSVKLIPSDTVTGGDNTTNNNKTLNAEINNYFTPKESTPYETAKKQRQELQKLAVEWG